MLFRSSCFAAIQPDNSARTNAIVIMASSVMAGEFLKKCFWVVRNLMRGVIFIIYDCRSFLVSISMQETYPQCVLFLHRLCRGSFWLCVKEVDMAMRTTLRAAGGMRLCRLPAVSARCLGHVRSPHRISLQISSMKSLTFSPIVINSVWYRNFILI